MHIFTIDSCILFLQNVQLSAGEKSAKILPPQNVCKSLYKTCKKFSRFLHFEIFGFTDSGLYDTIVASIRGRICVAGEGVTL